MSQQNLSIEVHDILTEKTDSVLVTQKAVIYFVIFNETLHTVTDINRNS